MLQLYVSCRFFWRARNYQEDGSPSDQYLWRGSHPDAFRDLVTSVLPKLALYLPPVPPNAGQGVLTWLSTASKLLRLLISTLLSK